MVYFFIYTVRVKGMTFGFGPLFSGLDKAIGAAKAVFRRNRKSESKDTV